jgi:S-DNA-T family DNA segregation ATPase FtsK/SpoIIIE
VRIDLTIRRADGSERDVAITAPRGATFADIAAVLAQAAGGTTPAWSGRRRLAPDALLGRGPLAAGTVLADAPQPAEGAGPGARLEIIAGPRAGTGVAIRHGELAIGRDAGCGFVLDDPRVSRRHAVVVATAAGLLVQDLGSTHGTSVDGVPVVGESAVPLGSVVRVGDTFLAVSEPSGARASVRDGPDGGVLVSRPPRPRDTLDDRVIELPARPGGGRSPRVQWAAAMLPALAGAGLAWAMHSMQFLAFAALTPLALLAAAFGDRLHWRRDRRRAVVTYRQRCKQVEGQIASALHHEGRLRRVTDPDPGTLLRVARTPGAQLWQRRRAAPDLLRVRVGFAALTSALRVGRDSAIAPAAALTAVPCTVDLRQGAIGIAAPALVGAALARWMLGQLAVLAAPADLELALLLADPRPWTWARWLPHLRGRIACAGSEHDGLVDELVELARGRTRSPSWPGPWLVVLVDAPARISGFARLSAVLGDGASVGVTAICLADHASDVPAACSQIIHAVSDTASVLKVGTTDVVGDRVDVGWADHVARALAPLRDADADPSTAVPALCRLAELLGDDPPTEAAIRQRWRHCDGTARTLLGLGADGPVSIDLDRDGPHVLVAGTTGSGKSELLQTLVIGLAACQPPTEITFLLVDYKGGAAFADCADLPHTVGLVTDLDEHLTRRVLASLDSEIRRRERLLAAAGVPHRAAYRAAGRSLPRLVLVVDEFAALAEELPGFVSGLVGIAQRGRSLGLHLVLATQRPAGVVSPEIRANTALRIALRVTSVADSADVIDGPEAATIDRRSPGRGYLRSGTDTTAFQTARVTAPRAATSQIAVARLDEWRRLPDEPPLDGASDLQYFATSIKAAGADVDLARRPWLPPLPARVPLAEPGSAASRLVPIGVADMPTEQRQDLLTLDLAQPGTVLVVGSARSGRSTALVTLAFAAARQCSPTDLQVQVIDGSGSLAALEPLPHVGTLAAVPDGYGLVARLVQRLLVDLAGRRAAHAAAHALPTLLVLVDGWESVVAGSEEYDGGRTTERLLAAVRDAPGAGATMMITGGRAALAPRLAAVVGTRFVLRLHDPGDYAQAGVDPRSVPAAPPPGRAVRVADGAEVQFAYPGEPADLTRVAAACAARWPGVPRSALRLRRLPTRVSLADLTASAGFRLGVGGDEAIPIALDLAAGARRLVVAGPARSGRSTVLRLLLGQSADRPVLVAAGPRSPLTARARELDVPVLKPSDDPYALPGHGLMLVDDCEAFTETAVGAALSEWVRADCADRIAVVAGRNDAMAITFHGLAAEVRRAGCGVLLQPGPLDGELVGVSLPRERPVSLPGRAVLVPDPAWQLGDQPLPIQIAEP